MSSSVALDSPRGISNLSKRLRFELVRAEQLGKSLEQPVSFLSAHSNLPCLLALSARPPAFSETIRQPRSEIRRNTPPSTSVRASASAAVTFPSQRCPPKLVPRLDCVYACTIFRRHQQLITKTSVIYVSIILLHCQVIPIFKFIPVILILNIGNNCQECQNIGKL